MAKSKSDFLYTLSAMEDPLLTILPEIKLPELLEMDFSLL
jgi:hypothetical protein